MNIKPCTTKTLKTLYKSEFERLEGSPVLWFAFQLDWKVDHVRKIVVPIFSSAEDIYEDRELILNFLKWHSQEVRVKLLNYDGGLRHINNVMVLTGEYHEGYLLDMAFIWDYLQANHTEVLSSVPRNCKRDMMRYHDWLSSTKTALEPDYEIPDYPEVRERLENFLGFKAIIPTNTQELKSIGNRLDHCLGTYGSKCLSGDSIIIHFQGPANEYTAELKGRWINQFVGKNNKPAPEVLKQELAYRLGYQIK
jgi:hypothetical protein